MPEAYESFTRCYGVDTYPAINSEQSRSMFLSHAVNRSTIRSINETRPPFVEVPVKFEDEEQEKTFRYGAISGMKFYEGEGSLFAPHLIVAVGDLILAGIIRGGVIEFATIYKGIDPQWTHSFFVQALNILVFNNGKDSPLFWKGRVNEKMKPVYESSYVKGAQGDTPMMVGNVATFAHGMIFIATPNNLVYASDWIYSAGLAIEQREAVLSFRNSTYPSGGDGFGSPSEMGDITGIIAIPQSDTLNGHGDVMVACKNGFFSISPNRKVRNQWTDDPEMQRSILVGKGCAAHESLIPFANQIFYRDSEAGISSLLKDISHYQQRSDLESVSNYVDAYTSFDNDSPDIRFTSSIITDKRLLTGVNYRREVSPHMGIHRFAIGMVSLCSQQRQGETLLSWEGLWTGPRMVAGAVMNLGGSKQTIVASYDTDGQNRLYRISDNRKGDDIVNGGRRSIKSAFSYNGLFFNEQPRSPITPVTIKKLEALMVNSNPVAVHAQYSADMMPERYPMQLQLTEIEGCGKAPVRVLSSDICSTKNSTKTTSTKSGYMFDIHFYVEGEASFAKIAVAADLKQSGFDTTKCVKVTVPGLSFNCDTTTLSCPVWEQFNYLF